MARHPRSIEPSGEPRARVWATRRLRFVLTLGLLGCIGLLIQPPALAEQLIQLRNGLNIRGEYIELATLNEADVSADEGIQNRPIWMIDDGLRRTHVHRRGMVAAEPTSVDDLLFRLEIPQPVPDKGADISGFGLILGITPFDHYGRRQLRVRGPKGTPIVIHQGISELTARYVKVEGLKSDKTYRLDMRLATESLSTARLRELFRSTLDWDDPDERLEAVRFFAEAKRYGDARDELLAALAEFPELEDLRVQLATYVELQAEQLIEQAKLRRQAGQPKLAKLILQNFPLQRVSKVMRLRVQDELTAITAVEQSVQTIKTNLGKLVSSMPDATQQSVAKIVEEIDQRVSPATLARMSDFVRLGDNQAVPADQRLALAIAGWITGSGSGEANLKIATSMIRVRQLVIDYLNQPDSSEREKLVSQIATEEAGRPPIVAATLASLMPPKVADSPDRKVPQDARADERVLGQYHFGLDQTEWQEHWQNQPSRRPDASYVIQLPPEYDPLREYPCIVALHAAPAWPETQLTWWAGTPNEQFLAPEPGPDVDLVGKPGSVGKPGALDASAGTDKSVKPAMRMGHAMRHGFIVIAPRWTRAGQRGYEYTAREHDAVLLALRHAMRRFSIDSDHVFIAGHGAGATAAWDIGISHPDLWAGVVALNASPEKTLQHYKQNGTYVPTYFVFGGKDGRPFKQFGAVYNDYMTYQHDSMVVSYRGRGREFFFEEADRIFEWMKAAPHRRRAIPKDIDVVTMRQSDHFFWWLEWGQMLPGTAINPVLWQQASRIKAAPVSASINANNEIRISQAPANAFTVWISPEMSLDLSEPIAVRYRGRRVTLNYDQDLSVMLEDARRRADRKRPFWAKVTIP